MRAAGQLLRTGTEYPTPAAVSSTHRRREAGGTPTNWGLRLRRAENGGPE